MQKRPFFISSLSLMGACAAPAEDYPSLLPRPIEQISFAEPERPQPEAVTDAALEVEIAGQARALAAAGGDFDRVAGRAERLGRAAAGSAAGTEAWITAQLALSELDALRAATSNLLTDIERLAIDRAAKGLPAYPELQRLLARAETQNRAQIERIDSIERGVRPAA